MKTYKIIKRNQFAYGPVTSRNGDKISVALLEDYDEAIVSQAYTVFEVKDEKELHPDYLMMWMRRPEFDRYARFKSHGSAREVFDWDEMCETELPIPSPEKQNEIVKEYNTIKNRIALNNQLIQKLEETARTIYKQWFVDFEFPNENGKPYKSSGGEMVWSEELDKEIPEGWEFEETMNNCLITSSKRIFESEYQTSGIPFYRAGEIKQKKEGRVITDALFISQERFKEVSDKFGSPKNGDILLTAVGSLLGVSYLVDETNFYFKDGNVVWFKDFIKTGINLYMYGFLQSQNFIDFLDEIKIGSGQSAITIKSLNEKKLIFPDENILQKHSVIMENLYENISIKKKQNIQLINFSNLLLSKLVTIEN